MKTQNEEYSNTQYLIRALAKESIFTFFTKIILFIISFLKSIIIARTLGPLGKGVWAALLFIPLVTVTFINLGIGPANVYYTGKGKYPIYKILINSFYLIIILSVFTFLVYLLFFDKIFTFVVQKYPNISHSNLWIVLLNVPFLLVSRYVSGIIQGKQKINLLNIISLVSQSLHFIFIFFALVILNYSLSGLIYIYFLINGLHTILLILFTSFILKKEKKESKLIISFDFKLFKKTLSYGIKCFLGSTLQYLNYRADVFLLFTFTGAQALGIYTVGVAVTEILWFVSYAISFSLFPKISSAERSKNESIVPLFSRITLFLTIFLSLFILILINPIIKILYGLSFLPSIKVVYFLLPGIILFSPSRILSSYFAGIGKPEINTWVNFFSLIINILFNLLLIPKFSYKGAAIASSISYSISFFILLYLYIKKTKSKFIQFFIPSKKDIITFKNFKTF